MSSISYRPEIDGLRSIAVLPVILFHAGFEVFSGGFVGVDVFFVISGYLITAIILKEQEEGRFSLLGFYDRRARRILPALFFVVLCSIPFAWGLMTPPELENFGKSLVAIAVFASNILFWRESGYFSTAAEEKPMLHTWSLAVEEQYYMLFPLFVMAFWGMGRKKLALVTAGLAVASLILAEAGWRYFPRANFYLAPTRVWELLAGSLAAFALFGRAPKPNEALAGLGLLLIIGSILVFDHHTPFPSLWALAPVGGSVLIVLYATPETLVGRLLSTRVLVGIGLISYSAYLWHQPLFAFARLGQVATPLVMLGLAILSLALAAFSWRFIEQPFRKRGTGFLSSTPRVLGTALVAMVVCLGIGLAGYVTNGFLAIKSNSYQLSLFKTTKSNPRRNPCHTVGEFYLKPQEACVYFGDTADTAVFGNSHAVELAHAVAKELEPQGRSVRHLSFSGCAPVYGRSDLDTPCRRWTDEAVAYVAGDPGIRTVVVSYRINSALFGGHSRVYPRQPDGIEAGEQTRRWQSYLGVLEAFRDAGKQVILVLQAPELSRHVDKLIFFSTGETIESVPRIWWEARNRFVMEHLGDIPEGVRIIDPTETFCGAESCIAAENGIAYYFDDNHMSLAGARRIARQVVAEMRE
jgi:peptidoglycan/LPS O-acetylase OafA/YrhL